MPSTMAKPYGQGAYSIMVTPLIGAIGLSGHAVDMCTLGEDHAHSLPELNTSKEGS
jgi:hypothetical protein